MDADSNSQLSAVGIGRLTTLAERPLDGEGGQEGAPHMVLVSERRSEQGHEPVAGELRRRTPVAMHLGETRLEKCADEIAHSFGSQSFGQRCRVDDVAE